MIFPDDVRQVAIFLNLLILVGLAVTYYIVYA